MPNTREKLIELCEDVILSCKSSLCDDCEHNCIDYPACMGVHFADHLIANGVTINRGTESTPVGDKLSPTDKDINVPSKWISVNDPPGKKGCYLVTVKHWCDGKPVTREAYYTIFGWISCEKAVDITSRVTHWQPMPQPQKGE